MDAKTYLIPVSPGCSIRVEGQFPLSEDEWDQLLAVLQAMKPGLVAEPKADPTHAFARAHAGKPYIWGGKAEPETEQPETPRDPMTAKCRATTHEAWGRCARGGDCECEALS